MKACKPMGILTAGLVAGCMMWGAGTAGADVITYNNGKVIKGICEESPEDPTTVTFIGADLKAKIPRSRIANIQKESRAQGHIHIGNALRAKGKLTEAMAAYQEALSQEPGNADAQKMIDQVQALIADEQKLDRQQALGQIDELSQKAKDLAGKEQFDEAEKLLRQADHLVPNEDQKKRLALQISDFYLAWADSKLDRYDKPGAEEMLNLSLAANPDNEEVISRLLTLWENDPDKRENSANVYETLLERNPSDATLRLKLGDLYYKMQRYDDAAHHYLKLYSESEEYKGTEMEERLKEILERLHLRYAREKDYEKAIYFYNLLATIDPSTDPSSVIYYQYLLQKGKLTPEDWAGKLGLAQYAEKNGLDTEAVEGYRELQKNEKTSAEAMAGLTRYASRAMQEASIQFDKGDYRLAQALADQVRTDYPDIQEAVTAANALIGKASAEIAKDRRQREELGKEVLERADQFYDQANFHYNNLFSTERESIPGLGSPRSEAKRYYKLAIQSYEEALDINPALGTQSNSLVNVRLAECKDRLARLTSSPTSYRQFGRSPSSGESTVPLNR